MRRAKLNTHTDASGNLCARSPNRVKRRNGWHEISGASACRCRSCWPRPMYGTPRWFLGLENGLINALHIVDDQCWKRKNTWLHKWSCMLWLWYGTIVRVDIFHIIEVFKDSTGWCLENIVKLLRNTDPLYILVQTLPQLSNPLPLPSPTSLILHIASHLFFHPAIFMTSPYPSYPSSPPFPILCLSSHFALLLSS